MHLNLQAPLARHLGEVLGYPGYTGEIFGAGAPASLAKNRDLPGREFVRALVPELRRSPCSALAWALRGILREAYGFQDELTEANWEALFDKAEQARNRPERLKEICRSANVAKILIHTPQRPLTDLGADASLFAALSDFHMPSIPNKKALGRMEKQTGLSIASAQEMRQAAFEYLKRAAAIGQRGIRMDISPEYPLCRRSDADVETAFSRAASDKDLSGEEKAVLSTFALDTAAAAAGEAGMTVQLFIGIRAYGGVHLPSDEQSLIGAVCEFLAGHPGTTFEVYACSEGLRQNLCLCAKAMANVHLAGCWWFSQFPEISAGTYSLRFDMLPASKWCAFFSDAYVAEWIIGKVAVVRNELARVLASKVLAGYMPEDSAPTVARQVLFETPCRLYRLS